MNVKNKVLRGCGSAAVAFGAASAMLPAQAFADEGSGKFKLLTVVLGVIGCLVALKVPFNTLVNYIYVINGYVGALLILLMGIKYIQIRRTAKNTA